ncbi:putative magnesium transporter NIPA8 [Porphyridium purpureum]|uniref:Putative magnesium transporter NIPA8 n=1 Tax=Porphyridium purpureum TaxID=35688 RepID=A0A5J4Z2W9_PORPP|nr:putative magnesium transporter NIPA8 [Porphyridium purpureum]|eukprot:POR4027..scf295_1
MVGVSSLSFGWPSAEAWYWHGVLMNVVGTVLYTVGCHVYSWRRRAAIRSAQEARGIQGVGAEDGVSGRSPETKGTLEVICSLWPISWILIALGLSACFFSFRSTPASVLCAFSTIQFMTFLVFRSAVHKRHPSRRSLFGYVLITLAMCIVLSAGPTHVQNYHASELAALVGSSAFVSYMLCASSLTVFLWQWYASIKQRAVREHEASRFEFHMVSAGTTRKLMVLYSVRAAIWGSPAVIFAKGLSLLLFQELDPGYTAAENSGNPWKSPVTYLFIVGLVTCALHWARRVARALRNFEAFMIVPLLTASFLLFSAISSGIYFQEFHALFEAERAATISGALSVSLFSFGFILLVVGAYLICPRRPSHHPFASVTVTMLDAFTSLTEQAKENIHSSSFASTTDEPALEMIHLDRKESVPGDHSARNVVRPSMKHGSHEMTESLALSHASSGDSDDEML